MMVELRHRRHHRRRRQPFSLLALSFALPSRISLIIILQLLLQPTKAITATYLPISYNIPSGQEECLYEHITTPNEMVTSSVFVYAGDDLRCSVTFEGPVAPVDLNLTTSGLEGTKNGNPGGRELSKYLKRYNAEGMEMFVRGKFGDSMLNVKPVRLVQKVNFEDEDEEDYLDDFEMTERQREEFNKHHDLEHQRFERSDIPPDHPPVPKEKREHKKQHQHEHKEHHRRPDEIVPDIDSGSEDFDDDYVRAKEEARQERMKKVMEREAELDDDFVKLQIKNQKANAGRGPQRRNINDAPVKQDGGYRKGGGGGENNANAAPEERPRRRLAEEEYKLLPGEPYQKTVQIESPGWYRLCVRPQHNSAIEAEIELRKSSINGPIDPRTGHVPSLEEVELHSEIHALYAKEDDDVVLSEEGLIQDEDLRTTKEQLRILQRVYADIINKQLEERRTWDWRTVKNAHIYSHLVLGNLIETVVYMGITGLQVYTIRKWFGGGPALGR